MANTENPKCPKCSGEMWDNREKKTNPKAPDFKCKEKGCEGVIWPPRAKEMAKGTEDDPACPECKGRMWDNREGKRNPKSPDFKCRDKACEGVIWPPKDGEEPRAKKASVAAKGKTAATTDDWETFVPPGTDEDEDLPF